jgi:hypothetical protein
MSTIRAIRFPVDGPPVEVQIDNTLEAFQAEVGGYIEVVGNDTGCGTPVNLVINEEGKLYNLPANPEATKVVRSVLRPGDTICGNAVLVGPVVAGEFTSLPEWLGVPE